MLVDFLCAFTVLTACLGSSASNALLHYLIGKKLFCSIVIVGSCYDIIYFNFNLNVMGVSSFLNECVQGCKMKTCVIETV